MARRILCPDEVGPYIEPKPTKAELYDMREVVNRALRGKAYGPVIGKSNSYIVDTDNFRPVVVKAVVKELQDAGWLVEAFTSELGPGLRIAKKE